MKSFFEMLKLMGEARGMGPTRDHVRTHLRTVPHVVGKFDSSTREWRIAPRHLKGEDQENSAYYTNDHQDAMDTATHMHHHIAGSFGHSTGLEGHAEVEG